MAEPQPNSYIIRTLEIEKGAYFRDANGIERWKAIRLSAVVGRDTSLPFVSSRLEELADQDISNTIKRTAGPKDKTLGEVLDRLEWFRSKKRPEMELTSKECETLTLLMDNIRKTGTFEYEGFSYFIMKDGKTVGRVPIQ